MSVASCDEARVGVQARRAGPSSVPTTTSCGSARSWLARKDSNLRSPDPESGDQLSRCFARHKPETRRFLPRYFPESGDLLQMWSSCHSGSPDPLACRSSPQAGWPRSGRSTDHPSRSRPRRLQAIAADSSGAGRRSTRRPVAHVRLRSQRPRHPERRRHLRARLGPRRLPLPRGHGRS
jgi:hypothetical protein